MKQEIVLTMGASPLPILTAVLDYQDQLPANLVEQFKCHLVYTTEVADLADRVFGALRDRNITVDAKICVEEHWNVQKLWRKLKDDYGFRWGECALNYTGGTKLLSAHIRRWWEVCGGQPEDAFYLAANGRLWSDDGKERTISSAIRLTLDEIVKLHFGASPNNGDEFNEAFRLEIANLIQQKVKTDGIEKYLELLPPLYGRPQGGWSNTHFPEAKDIKFAEFNAAHEDNFKAGKVFSDWNLAPLSQLLVGSPGGLVALVERLNLSGNADRKRRNTTTWLYGDWLEVWLAHFLKEFKLGSGKSLFDEVHQDVKAVRIESGKSIESFQADVVALRGHRTVLFTCTVDKKASTLKQKLFEGLSRGRRLAGEHARVALVCMSDDPVKVLQNVRELGWEGYDEVRVFGEAHVRGDVAPCSFEKDHSGNPVAKTLQQALEDWFE